MHPLARRCTIRLSRGQVRVRIAPICHKGVDDDGSSGDHLTQSGHPGHDGAGAIADLPEAGAPASGEPMNRGQGGFGRFQGLVRGRSVYLLVSLLGLLTIGPWLNERLLGFAIWELLFSLVMLSAIREASVDSRQALIAGLLAVPTMASLWLRQFFPDIALSHVGLGLLTLFLLYTAGTLLLAIFKEESVSMDTLSAAFCVYLLIGLAWGCLFGLIYLQDHGAFHLPEGIPKREVGITIDVPLNLLIYFSFVTLTTLGYGDVLPVTDISRAVATLEAVVGHFYLAILVARLVGLHIADSRKPN